ncbi:MAG: Fur family transcriptional regulator, stress-responsive regulator [Actinomycetota bacterium]|nr:transcriptional repressor [Glaciihabitans sp.]MDQ1561139.1 Fur family transcriptional regulator, stress-responsive regulator [Actinomycetota bacterium]MDQ1573260.1 Fur family transcriptional regulator, stress-responsive regulator [Actinomycetota bacterium]
MSPITPIEDELRLSGLRATVGRLEVLKALEEHPHSDADRLHGLVAPGLPRLSIQSVHNVLSDLTRAGLVRRIEPARSAALYERRIDDNHHHVVCTECGAVADVDCVVGSAPCLHPSDSAGYRIEEAEVTFWGRCAKCVALESGSFDSASVVVGMADGKIAMVAAAASH